MDKAQKDGGEIASRLGSCYDDAVVPRPRNYGREPSTAELRQTEKLDRTYSAGCSSEVST
jgi:hypothetical protein